MKKLVFITATVIFSFSLAEISIAQWGIGASYEIRDEHPEKGFGLRAEREILSFSLIDLNMRAHFSYYNESSNASIDGVTITRDFDAYDAGLAALAGVNIGLVRAYGGVGVSLENFERRASAIEEEIKESNFYYSAIAGAEVSILPAIRPFVEYRATRVTSPDELDFDRFGLFAVGIMFRF